jgi:hypothetical protein
MGSVAPQKTSRQNSLHDILHNNKIFSSFRENHQQLIASDATAREDWDRRLLDASEHGTGQRWEGDHNWALFSEGSEGIKRWDAFLCVLIAFTATFTVFEISFMETSIDYWFGVNRVIDCAFLADIGLNFCRPYYFKNLRDPANAGRWVHRRQRIAMHYITTWLTIDVLSAIPFDAIVFLWQRDHKSSANLAVLRILKVLKLLKLFRVVKGLKILKRGWFINWHIKDL